MLQRIYVDDVDKIKIEDDFLKQEEFDQIQKGMWGNNPRIPWFYASLIDIDSENEKNDVTKFQFCHLFYVALNEALPSPFLEELDSIMIKLNPVSVFRIKANLLTRTSNIVENTLHVDIGNLRKPLSEEKLKQWTTSIFYINTNNGYTKFEDGTIVESVANRMVTFPANIQHTGTTCTDEQARIVINFNYFKP